MPLNAAQHNYTSTKQYCTSITAIPEFVPGKNKHPNNQQPLYRHPNHRRPQQNVQQPVQQGLGAEAGAGTPTQHYFLPQQPILFQHVPTIPQPNPSTNQQFYQHHPGPPGIPPGFGHPVVQQNATNEAKPIYYANATQSTGGAPQFQPAGGGPQVHQNTYNGNPNQHTTGVLQGADRHEVPTNPTQCTNGDVGLPATHNTAFGTISHPAQSNAIGTGMEAAQKHPTILIQTCRYTDGHEISTVLQTPMIAHAKFQYVTKDQAYWQNPQIIDDMREAAIESIKKDPPHNLFQAFDATCTYTATHLQYCSNSQMVQFELPIRQPQQLVFPNMFFYHQYNKQFEAIFTFYVHIRYPTMEELQITWAERTYLKHTNKLVYSKGDSLCANAKLQYLYYIYRRQLLNPGVNFDDQDDLIHPYRSFHDLRRSMKKQQGQLRA